MAITKAQLSCKKHLFNSMHVLGKPKSGINSCVVFHDTPTVSQLNYHVRGEIAGSPARFLFDSGGSVNCNAISEDFCKRYGIAIEKCSADVSLMIVGSGPDQQPSGHCKLKCKIQTYHGNEGFLVLPIAQGYDVLLGAPWLNACSANLKYEHEADGLRSVRITKGSRCTTLT